MSDEQLRLLLYPASVSDEGFRAPDCERIHRELAKKGVTLSLLWNEYSAECRESGEIPLMYTQFCKRYREYAVIHKATMHIERKPGEQMEVDWAGTTMGISDSLTGGVMPAYIFVAVLPYSGYAYAEAFMSRNQENWIAAHVNAYHHFGGVARVLIPDNLKTGVDRIRWYTPVINRVYQEMAEHYGVAVIPARVRKPKDKPSVEGAVGMMSTWIIATLRNWKFFTVQELNDAIAEKLAELNRKPFQKKPGSRESVFIEQEQSLLNPLPERPFENSEWKVGTVAFNYHVLTDKMYYSVPYRYIKQKADIRLTRNTVELFIDSDRVASHVRLRGNPGQYSTLPEHMPEDHKKYTRWNAERFLSWAKSIGQNTETVTKTILASRKVEQQGYRACMALLKLADKHTPSRLEAACKRALAYTSSPSFKSIQIILASGQDEPVSDTPEHDPSAEFGITRGSGYYGGDV
jgi:transposase